jgi:hypothetical protein
VLYERKISRRQQGKSDMFHSVFINPDGSTRGVYTDDLISIYEQLEHEKIRASNVEFDKETGMWVAIDAETGYVITSRRLRADAIKDEIEYLNEKFRGNVTIDVV